jgi:DUF4097 and DUF4098 domain-containing protein YvlB
MTRTAILTIATILAATLPAAAQESPAEAAAAAKAEAKVEAKAARAYQRAERIERVQREQREKREDQRAEQTETVSRTVKLGAQGEIDVHNMSGSVTVSRGSGSDASITATKRARAATDADAKEMLGLVKVEITERTGRVEVQTHYGHADSPAGRRGRRNVNVSVDYTITAPAGTKVRVNSMSGDIAVSDITGDLMLEAMSGNIKIDRGARVLTARTMSGDVVLTDVKSDGAVDAGSMSGDVTLRQVKARRVNASVISGTVSLADVECERLEAQTTSGDVVYEGPLAKGARYHFQSHSGDVKLMLAGNIGFELDANSWGGNIRSDLALTNRDAGIPDPGAGRGPGRRVRTLKGTYGDGSAVLDLTTFSGTIVIGKRAGR